MKNLKKISREALKSLKGGTKEGCPRKPITKYYDSQVECEAATGQKCSFIESYCFGPVWIN